MEKLILKNFKQEIFEKHVIPDFQFGFKNSHSTSLQLARLVDLIVTVFIMKRRTAAVLLDIEKAFDKTWISGLIYKLIQINVSRATIKLLSSYLTNRKCFVSVEGFNSNKIKRARLSQGAVLSPLLYNVYVAGIPTCNQIHNMLMKHVYIFKANLKIFQIPCMFCKPPWSKSVIGLQDGISKSMLTKLKNSFYKPN